MNVYKSGQKLKDAFNKLDFDRDGYIALSELHRSLALVDINDELTIKQQKRLYKAYKHLDDDHDGRLDYNEFFRAVTKPDYSTNIWQRFLCRTVDIVSPTPEGERIYDRLNKTVCIPPPLFFITLSLIQIVCHVIFTILPYGFDWMEGCPGCYNATSREKIVNKLVFISNYREDAWRYISYILIHSGFLHIAGNVLIQICIGVPYEIVHKTWRVAFLYIVGILCGSLLLPIIDPKVVLVGSSSGCYALLIVHIINFIKNWCSMKWRWSHSTLLIIFLGADLCMGAYRRLTACEQISLSGHLGGVFVGCTLGLGIFLKKISYCANSSKIGKALCRSLSVIVFISIFAALICLNVILPVNNVIFPESICNYTIKN